MNRQGGRKQAAPSSANGRIEFWRSIRGHFAVLDETSILLTANRTGAG